MDRWAGIRYPNWVRCDGRSLPVADDLVDRGFRYFDRLETADGWIYKLTGDLHPSGSFLAEPDWGPVSDHPNGGARLGPGQVRNGRAKVRHHRWPDGRLVPPRFPAVIVPTYGRATEVVPALAIARFIRPEDVATTVAANPGPLPQAQAFALVYRALLDAGLTADEIGLNGSFAADLATPRSDVDLDIYGARAGEMAARLLVSRSIATAEGWTYRWPLDEQTSLHYSVDAVYRDVPPDTIRRYFVDGGREIFNFALDGIRISFAYHAATRREPSPAQTFALTALGPAEVYLGMYGDQKGVAPLDSPAFVTIDDVVSRAGQRLGRRTVVSMSRGFHFCRPGDQVWFRALPSTPRSPGGEAPLVIPHFGRAWPIAIADVTTAARAGC